jgi:hypothetical protein
MTDRENMETLFATMEQWYPMPAPTEKRGHKCCGVYVRRAVIVVNLISIWLSLDILMAGPYEDDSGGLAWIASWFQLSLCGMGLYGAVTVKEGFVTAAFVAYIVMFFVDAVIFCMEVALLYYFFMALLNAFFAYPHYFLIKEIQAGIMTEESYPNEKPLCSIGDNDLGVPHTQS